MDALVGLFDERTLPVWLAIGFALLVLGRPRQARRAWRPRLIHGAPHGGWKAIRAAPMPPRSSAIDPTAQLRAVMASDFTAKRVLSLTESKVMRAAEAAIAEAGVKWRVMAQVSLGEVLDSPEKAAFNAINAKRVDLLIISATSEPIAAIEYQGQGHYQGTAPARDAIKKEALRKAGIGYIEITFEHGPEDVRREVARLAWTIARKREPPPERQPTELGHSRNRE